MNDFERAEEIRLCRLVETLKEFLFFQPEVQMDLAQAAIDLVFASLAESPRCPEIESYFWLMVDQTYMGTSHAASQIGEDERHRLCMEAFHKCEEFLPTFREIMIESSRVVKQFGQGDFRGRLVRDLSMVRMQLIDYADPADLQDLIGPCIALCRAIRLCALGVGSPSDMVGWAARVSSIALKIWKSVENLIQTGKLSVKGGKIIKATV